MIAKKLVIYHKNCLDGFGAAFAAWYQLGFSEDITYIPLDYSERAEFMDSHIANYVAFQEDIEIYVLDFSFSKQDTEELIKCSTKFVWLDHHKTAFEAWCDFAKDFYERNTGDGIYIKLDNNKSGAVLAWEYFNPILAVPKFIEHIDDRDRWQWKLKGTKHYCLALSQLPQDFNIWDTQAWDTYNLATVGKTIQEYYDVQLKRSVDATKEYCSILGNEGLCCNLPPMFASEAGNLLALESGTFGATWFKASNGDIKWSLRSIGDFDVSAIAKQFRGGGHKNAAGFTLTPESGETIPGVKLWLI